MSHFNRDPQRELGRIASISNDIDHDTFHLMIDDGGAVQGFGGLLFVGSAELRADFERSIAQTFGVDSLDQVVGKSCFALRCWGHHNDEIEGLESVDTGRRLTLTGWLRRMLPEKAVAPIDRRRAYLLGEIQFALSNAKRFDEQLSKIYYGYIDWETALPTRTP